MQALRHLIVLAAPHRLPFLVGTLNLALLAIWWAFQLSGHWADQGAIPMRMLHGPAMIYLLFPPFIFGFLLTTFPRWMNQPDFGLTSYAPIAILLMAGSLAAHTGLWTGLAGAIEVGFFLIAFGWLLAIFRLVGVVATNRRAGRPGVVHAWSALLALSLGLLGLLLATGFVFTFEPWMWLAGNRIGLNGFLLPVFLTVAHRMVPFFAGNVVKGYVRWRPDWLLLAIWALLGIRLVGELGGVQALAVIGSGGLALLTAWMLWKWWPHDKAPGLLHVLFWGLLWAPIGFAMQTAADLGASLGLGPDHALFIGFAGCLVVAMVTRVTQGHSGRPLEMSTPAWIAFFGMQATAILRVTSAIRGDLPGWLSVTAAVFVVGVLPWCVHHGLIYLKKRVDGRPG